MYINKNYLTYPSIQLENTNNNCSVTISPVIVYKNNKIKSKNSLNIGDYTTENQTVSCKNVEIDEVFITSDCSKNVSIKTINKMQKNISFSNEKLWEINRVNQILHNKITNGAKPTYTRIKPPTSLVKATSTINRERKNKDIVKENEVSLISTIFLSITEQLIQIECVLLIVCN